MTGFVGDVSCQVRVFALPVHTLDASQFTFMEWLHMLALHVMIQPHVD